jgi:pimeloyl-ACP methyl ester carboxylesterase
VSIESPVVIAGPGGDSMFAVVHEPARPLEPRVGVNLLNPGLKSRVAPNRLNVVLARRLAEAGYYVLRFDPPGIGDSAGDLEERPLPDLWQTVQLGAFVEATRLANDAFARACGLAEIVGIGNCGGAITALLEARVDPRVRRLILLDLPVTVREADLRRQKTIRGARHGRKVLGNYARRLRDPRAWLRLVTLRSDVRTLGKALRARFLDRETTGVAKTAESPDNVTVPTSSSDEILNPFFFGAFEDFDSRGGAALFINAGNYDNTYTFDRIFADRFLAAGTTWGSRHQRVVVPGANHVYGTPEWRAVVLDRVVAWLGGDSGRLSPSDRHGELPVERSLT